MTLVSRLKDMIREQIASALAQAKEKGQITFDQIPAFTIEAPKEKAHGDFAVNAAMLLAKEAHLAPRKIAQIIVDNMSGTSIWLSKLEIAGPGFLNFHLQPSWVYEVIPLALDQDEKYGFSDFGKNAKVQVEFVSANPTGVLHMGNARGAALGDTLSNLLQAAGFDVTKEYYINDAGNQIEKFAASLEARYLQLHGQDVPFPEDGYHGEDLIDTVKNIIAEVGDKYLHIDSALRRELLVGPALNEKISAIKKALADFGVEYDVWFSEQSLHDSGAVQQTIEDLRARDYVYEKEGALWFKSTIFGDEKDEVLVKADGLPTYFAADIAYHRNKFERGFTKVINIWGADHHGHVARMKGAMQCFGYDPDNLKIILMQLVRLFRGKEIVRMSKRSGQYITLSTLIDEVGKDAARYFFVMRSPDSHLDFDLELAKAESSENPVYYVQYAHARICSIIQAGAAQLPKAEEVDFALLHEESELDLLRKIADLPDEIIGAATQEEPHRLTRYAHELASLFHSFYNNCRVLTDDEELKKARLLLVEATRITLRNVLKLLGVTAPDRM